jgi:hypothetical protein
MTTLSRESMGLRIARLSGKMKAATKAAGSIALAEHQSFGDYFGRPFRPLCVVRDFS